MNFFCHSLTNSRNEIAPREVCTTWYIDNLWYATKPGPQNHRHFLSASVTQLDVQELGLEKVNLGTAWGSFAGGPRKKVSVPALLPGMSREQ